jgi:hypothetical protein
MRNTIIRMRKQVKLSGRILTVVTAVTTEMVGYEERKRKSDWYDKDCQIKVEVRNKSRINVLNRRMRMFTENYKNK